MIAIMIDRKPYFKNKKIVTKTILQKIDIYFKSNKVLQFHLKNFLTRDAGISQY